MFSGGRPGAFVSTGYYPDLTLTYGDVEIILIQLSDGTEKIGMVFLQRWRKGENEALSSKFVAQPYELRVRVANLSTF
jgi:hypothetical protein